jgi:hypothetical protein
MSKKYNTLKDAKQDLITARAQLKEFRHEVSLLKKHGLITKGKYNARSVTPTKYLKSVISKFKNVLVGHATTAKVSKEKQKYYSGKGYTVKNNRVIVPISANERVISSHGDFRVRTQHATGSITRIDLGLSNDNINTWAKELSARKIKLKEGERISFQLYGNNSFQSFQKFSQLIDYLQYYSAFEEAEESGDPHKAREFITNVVIFKIDRNANMPPRVQDPEREKYRREQRRIKHEAYLNRMTPEREEEYRQRRSEIKRNMRKNLTPEKKAQYKQAASARAKKSYDKRKESWASNKKGKSQ